MNSIGTRFVRMLANGGRRRVQPSHESSILSNIKTKGSITISNVSVGRGSVSEPAPTELPPEDSLYRGSRFDLAYQAKGVNVSLDLDSQVDIGAVKYRAQAFPETKQGKLKHLRPGVITPYGRVTEVFYDVVTREEPFWVVRTELYPGGVFYRPGSSAILCAIGA